MTTRKKAGSRKAGGKTGRGKAVKHYTHKEKKRRNLPTPETEKFMSKEDRQPVPHEPDIRGHEGAPLLAWERSTQPGEGFETPAHPLYIHEKFHPAGFVEQLRRISRSEAESLLFADFNGLPEQARYQWYQHEGNWQNRIIRGDSVQVMASLAAKEQLSGKVQMIYYDPPYGISFKSNMQVSTRSRNTKNTAESIPNDQRAIKTFRDIYKNGIHSYLDNIWKNLVHARELLHESGSLFLQIGRHNMPKLALVLDEVFGEENRVALITFAKSGATSSAQLPETADYLLWYAKDKEQVKYHQLYEPLLGAERVKHMSFDAMLELADKTSRRLSEEETLDPDTHIPDGARLYRRMPLASQGESTTGRSDPYEWNGKLFPCPPNCHWSVSHEGLDHLAKIGRLVVSSDESMLRWKRYEDETPGRKINNHWHRQMSPSDPHYVVETAESVIERCILMSTDPGDLVLDITCGSGTTAYVAEEWGRRWITTDTSAVAVALTRQRIAAGVFDYYMLQDSAEGATAEAELSGKKPPKLDAGRSQDAAWGENPASGFVYERTPRVSAAVLAYDQPIESILLVNRPLRSKERGLKRVSSPFTVESSSPYRYIPPDFENDAPTKNRDTVKAILSALEISGVQTPAGRLELSDLEPLPGTSYITHSARSRAQKQGAPDVQTAVAIAPDDLTVAGAFIDRAASEAADTFPEGETRLLVLAFAFEDETDIGGEQKRGRVQILCAQANRDLQVGGGNLLDTPSDSAFVLIGQPDIVLEKGAGGKTLTVEVKGFDTYDPATGNIGPQEENNRDQIDCWMIDTDYNGSDFFARRIHFPGKAKDRQIQRMKSRLGTRLNPDEWKAMLSWKSSPFPKPERKGARIAVRIITNTFVEMTAVLDVK